jgi:hypothetical protein
MPVIRAIVREAKPRNNSFSAVVLGIVRSAPFQMRTGAKAPASAAKAD